MSGITLSVAREHLNMWLEAEIAVSSAQSYAIGSRELSRADLSDILKQIEYWNKKVQEFENKESGRGRNRIIRVVPRDL